MEGSTFVTDSEVITYINTSMAELHDILIQKFEDYYVSSATYTLPDDNPGALPTNFYKVLGVDLETSGSTYRLRRYTFQERNMFNSPLVLAGRPTNALYSIQGGEIKFIPADTASGTITLHYVPDPQQFASDGTDDSVRLVSKAPQVALGYEEYIVIDSAIKCLVKEESDVKIHLAQKEQLRRRIEEAAGRRDAGEPMAISDVTTGTHHDIIINWL